MKYKEEHFDSAGAKALAKALAAGNDAVVRSGKGKKPAAGKKPASRKK